MSTFLTRTLSTLAATSSTTDRADSERIDRSSTRPARKWRAMLTTAVLLGACGGGGGGGSPPPPAKLEVQSVRPADGATGVALNAPIQATLSDDVDADSANATSFFLELAGNRVAGEVSTSAGGKVLSFQPDADLAPDSLYTAVLTTALKAMQGGELTSEKRWSFTTETAATQPRVTATVPSAGETDVSPDISVSVSFDQAMLAASFTTDAMKLVGPQGPVSGSMSLDASARKATLKPDQPLALGTTFALELSEAIQSQAGTTLKSQSFTFATIAAPKVIGTAPGDNEKDVSPMTVISVEFDRDMDPASVNAGTLLVETNRGPVSGGVSYDTGTSSALFRASRELEPGQTHIVTLRGLRSAKAIPLPEFTFQFDTSDRPRVTSTKPARNARMVKQDIDIEISFDRDIDSQSVKPDSVTLFDGTNPVQGTVGHSANKITFEPAEDLAKNTVYRCVVSGEIRARNGVKLGSDERFEFETESFAWGGDDPVGGRNGLSDAGPQLAFSEQGDGLAVWVQSNFTRARIYAARYIEGSGWRTPRELDPSATMSGYNPQVAMDRDGNGIAIWQMGSSIIPGDVSLRASRYDNQTGWGAAFDIVRETNHHFRHKDPRIAMSPDGRATIAWIFEDWFDKKYNVRYRRFDGNNLTAIAQITALAQDQPIRSLQLAQDDSGDAGVTFVQRDLSDRYRVTASTSSWGQSWSSPIPIDESNLVARDGRDPQIALKNGVLLAVWIQESKSQSVWRDRLWINRLALANGSWDGPELADDVNASDADDATVAMSDDGSAIVVWRQKTGTLPQLPKLGYRILDTGVDLTNGLGVPTLLDVNLRGYGDATPRDFQAGMDRQGNALVVYRQEISKDRYDVLSRRYRKGTGFEDAAPIERSPMPAQAPRLRVLADGRALALWYTYDANQGQLLANAYK